MAAAFRYTPSIASKKGVIGIGVLIDHCDESRSFSSAESAASLSVPQFMVARTGERKLRQLTQVVTGTPTRSSYRPQLALGAVVVAKLTTWRPNMAHAALGTSAATPAACIAAFPSTLSAPIAPQRMPAGRPRRNVVQMARYVAKRREVVPTPAQGAKVPPTPYQQACAEVAQLEGALRCLGDAWQRVSADLACAKASMHHLRSLEYAKGFCPVQGGAL